MYIEKLKLKNTSIKGSMSKIEQLKQKEEMGDVLHYIDFHQLQVRTIHGLDMFCSACNSFHDVSLNVVDVDRK